MLVAAAISLAPQPSVEIQIYCSCYRLVTPRYLPRRTSFSIAAELGRAFGRRNPPDLAGPSRCPPEPAWCSCREKCKHLGSPGDQAKCRCGTNMREDRLSGRYLTDLSLLVRRSLGCLWPKSWRGVAIRGNRLPRSSELLGRQQIDAAFASQAFKRAENDRPVNSSGNAVPYQADQRRASNVSVAPWSGTGGGLPLVSKQRPVGKNIMAPKAGISMIPLKLPTYQASEPAWLSFDVQQKKVAAPKDGHSCVGKLWLDLAHQVAPCHPEGA